ncbi:hypothetical protein FAF44_35995 [Nonomuraea sp. MG754425]|uniref:hypothetical protein n=1 Tax=Nonomuraea sp. MG754425 TaxID=2570319 RepID=UPI001F455643|nr:hypothetical protein [Nonomuraea sp. MG754425]MCF6473749.1 hypothetical protein [Nonomuraea sp. MG754425]
MTGLGAVWNTRIVRLMALLAFVLNAVDAPRATVLMPIYLRDIGAPEAALAWVAGTYTVGSLLGLVSYSAVAGKVRGERLIVWLLARCGASC